jgi:hypothetical protein
MNRFAVLVLALISINGHGEEPGHLVNEQFPKPPQERTPSAPSARTAPYNSKVSLVAEFGRARGLSVTEAQLLDVQRISCDRRIYADNGEALDGDADLKVTRVNYDLVEAEFPSYIYLSVHNPWQNGFTEIESASPRRLINLRGWQEGQSLRLDKRVTLVAADRVSSEVARSEAEFRIVRDTYPPQFIVREKIQSERPLTLYYFCI